MKKDLFWKIMAVLFFIWLCLWLWNSSNYITKYSVQAYTVLFRINKITGRTYTCRFSADRSEKGWIEIKKKKQDDK